MDFSYSKLTRLHTGNFVYPKLMAWEGALGVVPPECDGCVVSTEFPVFEIEVERVLPEVLDIYFRDPSVWPEISEASTGTNVRRRRLNPIDFLKYRMPLPSRETQMRLRQIASKLDALRRHQTETAAALEALLPAVLGRASVGLTVPSLSERRPRRQAGQPQGLRLPSVPGELIEQDCRLLQIRSIGPHINLISGLEPDGGALSEIAIALQLVLRAGKIFPDISLQARRVLICQADQWPSRLLPDL